MSEQSWEDTIGFRIVGGILGFIAGGPVGAHIGSMIGGAAGRMVGPTEGSPRDAASYAEQRAADAKYRNSPEYFGSGHG